ncbi:LPXTG cell wall anchor domain-containing protein [Listeria sp. FSL L7-0091]|uniref:MucBP domain-containing protein n=1 Tax=Listeria farberi TaxID=2713500 RepID=UPI0016296A91|nr:MucBP domain-containing protein [Listeria farberi]MBC2262820.1 LPXTG cell wall anchor domain-containing protein [Listeria farberi]
MKHLKKFLFALLILSSIISITFQPFSAKAAPLMLKLPEPQVDQLYIGDDYITGKLQQEVPMHYPGNAAYVLFNNKQYYITDYTVENDVNFRLKLPKTLEAGDTLNYFTITGTVLDPVAYPGQNSYDLAGPFTPIEKAKVQVNYLDESNETLATSDVLSGKLGENYTTSPKTMEGYQVKETPSNATGKYTSNTESTQVNYIYEKSIPEGEKVSVTYVDEATNEEIAPTETFSGKNGASFQAVAKEIDGYELSEMPTNQAGTFRDEPQSVIFKYKKITTPVEVAKALTVIYKDTEGNQLAEPIVLTGELGAAFETETKTFEGYTLTKTPVNHAGLFTNQTQEVAYVYSKDSKVIASTDSSESPTKEISSKEDSTDLIVPQITDNAIKTTNQSITHMSDTPTEKPFKPSSIIKLPKTGDTNNHLLVFIGFSLLVGGAAYIIISRKIAK